MTKFEPTVDHTHIAPVPTPTAASDASATEALPSDASDVNLQWEFEQAVAEADRYAEEEELVRLLIEDPHMPLVTNPSPLWKGRGPKIDHDPARDGSFGEALLKMMTEVEAEPANSPAAPSGEPARRTPYVDTHPSDST